MWIASLLLLVAAPDEADWIERLEFPRLVQADLNLLVRDEDLGLGGLELGFPEDPQVRVREAHARIEAGDRSSLTLHQAASGLVQLADVENLGKVMPACLRAYLDELKAAPDDTDLRRRFAEALAMAGVVIRDDRFFRDAGVELAKVAQARPDDWRVLDQHARVLMTRALRSRREGGPDPAWFGRAAELSAQAAALAPAELGPRWRRFLALNMALARSGKPPEEGVFIELAALADELAAGAREVGEPLLALVAEAYWFTASLAPVAARIEGEDWPAPADDETVCARLAAFRERLQGAPAGRLRADVARIWWMLTVFLGEVEGWRADLAHAVGAGLDREQGQVLALMGLHHRGAADEAGRLAAELATDAASDITWRALTVYRHEVGDDAGASQALGRVQATDPALRLARAQLELRTGRAEAARDGLMVLIGEVTGTPLAGPVAHAYGVALAVTGDRDGARFQLTLAARLLGEEDGAGARATLAEL